jgi:hypothetical protein
MKLRASTSTEYFWERFLEDGYMEGNGKTIILDIRETGACISWIKLY